MCSQTFFAEYDSCPAEVATWGDCLYGSGNCSGCAAEFEALDDCASGRSGTVDPGSIGDDCTDDSQCSGTLGLEFVCCQSIGACLPKLSCDFL
jgi:hypothetical protein